MLHAARKGALFVNSSTIDVDSARRAHALGKEGGFMSIDAPVSGGTGGAKAATLTFMCSSQMMPLRRPNLYSRRWGNALSIAEGQGPVRLRRSATT